VYSREELLELLRKVDAEVEGTVSKNDLMERDEYPSFRPYQYRFGSWNKAKKAAGLDVVEPDQGKERYSDEELLGLLRKKAEEVNGPVTLPMIDADEEFPPANLYKQRFGSLNEARKAAGLETYGEGRGQDKQYSREELLDKLRRVAADVDGPVSTSNLRGRDDVPSAGTYRRRFGSWKKAKEAAGIE